MDNPIRVMVVDDHEVFGESLSRALNDELDLTVVGVATTPAAAMLLLDDAVDVVLCDFRLGQGDGVSLTRQMCAASSVKVVMLTASHDDSLLASALEAGCTGFVTKSEPLATVLAAIRGAAVGESVITPSLLARLLPRLASRTTGPNTRLTKRELEVLTLMCDGGTNQQLADELGVSRDTVRNHVSSILAKLGVNSKLQAVTAAMQRGLVALPI